MTNTVLEDRVTVTLAETAPMMAANPNNRFFLVAEPGVGKTSLAAELSRITGYPYEIIDVPNMGIGDGAIPIPDMETKTLNYYPNGKFRLHEGKPVIICLDEFTNATFHIDTEMMPIVEGTDPCHWFFRQGYGKRDCATIRGFKAEGRLVEHANVSVPWAGIELIHIGGHCRGQMAIRVNTSRGPIVLASDAAHLYQEWEEERPFGVFYDMKAMLDGYGLLSDLPGGKRTEMIAGHDVEVMNMFPAPAKELEGVAVALHADPIQLE